MPSDSQVLLDKLCAAVMPMGLNHAGVVSAEVYNKTAPEHLQSATLMPSTQSIIVLSSGGSFLWEAFMKHLQEDPRNLTNEAHPLDAFVRRAEMQSKHVFQGVAHRWFFVAADADVHLDFRTLAVQAGLGSPSRLGLVIHPKWGPWMGLRAAVFVDSVIEPSPAIESVCEGCMAPCVTACPGQAFIDQQWDVGRCADFHRTSAECSQSCASRVACPVGEDARYPELARLYHYERDSGRRAVRRALGIGDAEDAFEGVGPHWGDWQTEPESGEDDT